MSSTADSDGRPHIPTQEEWHSMDYDQKCASIESAWEWNTSASGKKDQIYHPWVWRKSITPGKEGSFRHASIGPGQMPAPCKCDKCRNNSS